MITQLPSGPETLLIEAFFPDVEPGRLFRYWIEPEKLPQWWNWPQIVEMQPCRGGSYHLGAPQKNWHLRGSYTLFEEPHQLAFTWRWDHDGAEEATREVRLLFEAWADGQGTRLLLSHGPYEDTPRDQEVRLDQHLTGWQHFLSRLQALFQ